MGKHSLQQKPREFPHGKEFPHFKPDEVNRIRAARRVGDIAPVDCGKDAVKAHGASAVRFIKPADAFEFAYHFSAKGGG